MQRSCVLHTFSSRIFSLHHTEIIKPVFSCARNESDPFRHTTTAASTEYLIRTLESHSLLMSLMYRESDPFRHTTTAASTEYLIRKLESHSLLMSLMYRE